MLAKTHRIKMVEVHNREPLVLCAHITGQVTLWNYETKQMVKSFEISTDACRCAKFINRLQFFACGCDDFYVRIFNYNTMEKVTTFQAHDDYVRAMAVHEQLPYLLTAGDDGLIKAWDWTRNWTCAMIYEGHSNVIMSIALNPKDSLTFATASLDHTVRVWNVHSNRHNFVLNGHEEGVDAVDFYPRGDPTPT